MCSSDLRGYRYQFSHPETCVPWPVELSGFGGPARSLPDQLPWSPRAKMGLHQDRDELEFDAPVISNSLGNSCLFRLGVRTRSEPTRSIRLSSGDVLVLGGTSRLALHGVDRIYPAHQSCSRKADGSI